MTRFSDAHVARCHTCQAREAARELRERLAAEIEARAQLEARLRATEAERDAYKTQVFPVRWHYSRGYGEECICIHTRDHAPSIEVYLDAGGIPCGVVLGDQDGRIIGGAGLVPLEMVREEQR